MPKGSGRPDNRVKKAKTAQKKAAASRKKAVGGKQPWPWQLKKKRALAEEKKKASRLTKKANKKSKGVGYKDAK